MSNEISILVGTAATLGFIHTLIMYPAARGSMWAVALVASVFALTTIGTMLTIVYASSLGLSKLPFHKLERYSHALAGLAIFLSGGAIKFLGL